MNASTLVLKSQKRSNIHSAWFAVASRFLLHGLVLSTWASRIPSIQGQLNLSNASLGFALLGTAAGSVVSIFATSRLIGRLGSKNVTAWSTVALGAALLGPSFASGQWSLFAALLVLGAAAGANDVSMNAQGVAIEEAIDAPTMSRFHAMFSVGGLAGAGVGALVASRGIDPRFHFLAASISLCGIAVATAPFLFDASDARQGPREHPVPGACRLLSSYWR